MLNLKSEFSVSPKWLCFYLVKSGKNRLHFFIRLFSACFKYEFVQLWRLIIAIVTSQCWMYKSLNLIKLYFKSNAGDLVS